MGNELEGFQTTIKARTCLSGIGVHSGKPVTLHFQPADPDTGIVFQKTGRNGELHDIRAFVSEIGATELCTMLGNPSAAHISTVEHLMAAIFGLGIDNLIIEVEGDEAPILDGSARLFVEAFDGAGIEIQATKRRYVRILKPIRIESGGSWAEFLPHNGTRFEVEIDFDSPAIGRQRFASEITAGIFRREIARARTFGFMKDVERLWASGHALGSSLENSVVIGHDHNIINVEGLRWADEFVRHKTLDAIGDLALAGARFIGCFRSYRGGHRLNAAALRTLLSDRTAFEIVETNRAARGRSAELITVNAPAYGPWLL